MKTETVQQRWRHCIVVATGPSVFESVQDVPVRGTPIIVVNDAFKLLPHADVLYACDNHWWEYHYGTSFQGERWSTHEPRAGSSNDKTAIAPKFGIRCVEGKRAPGFSRDPSLIHYGDNSGFQAINLAILFGCEHIILIGFDMQRTGGKAHWFGDHPQGLGRGAQYTNFIPHFDEAAKTLEGVRIVNATPTTALKCFPQMSLADALKEQHELHASSAA